MSHTDIDVQDLWIERTAARLGFETLSRTLFGRPGMGPYLFIGTVVAFHLPVLSLVGWFQTGVLSIAVNPGEVFQVIAWPAIVWILLRTKSKYETAVNQLPDAIDDDVRRMDAGGPLRARLLSLVGVPRSPTEKADVNLDVIAPRRLTGGIFLVGLAIYATQLLLNPSSLLGSVAELTGPLVAAVRFYLIIPFVLYPIGAEFLSVVIGILVLLPFKIERARLVDFSDPFGSAGLTPAGDLFKSVAISYFILLTLFTTFQTVAAGTGPTNLFSSSLIVAGLVVGLVLFFAPLVWVKSFVADAKQEKIHALADRSREVGETDETFPNADPETVDDASQYTFNYLRMQRIDSTDELPLNTGMLQEILFALVLPYITSIAFDFLLQNMG